MIERKKAPRKADTVHPSAKNAESPAIPTPQSASTKKKIVAKKASVANKKKLASEDAPTASRTAASRKNTLSRAAASLPAPSAASKPLVSREERERMIVEASYLISQRRHPSLGSPETDWLSAETVIDMIFEVAD
jgi:hypothetical protein